MFFGIILFVNIVFSSDADKISTLSCHQQRHQHLSSFNCSCSSIDIAHSVYVDSVKCHENEVKLLPFICLSYSNTHKELVAGTCPYFRSTSHFTFPFDNITDLNSLFCSENRTGILCSKCANGTNVVLNSFKMNCIFTNNCHTYNWLLFLLYELVPVLLLFLVIVYFNITLTAGYANTYILYSQLMTVQINVVVLINQLDTIRQHTTAEVGPTLIYILLAFYSIWNLKLGQFMFPDVCIKHHIDNMAVILLNYTSAFLGLLLVFITYVLVELHAHNVRLVVWLWKPFSRCFSRCRRSINPSGSLINAFATFLLLSCSKITYTSILLLLPVALIDKNGNVLSHGCLYDGGVPYFSLQHLPYALSALFILIILMLVPSFFLLFYQFKCFQKCLEKFRLHRSSLIAFAEAYHGCFKDGSDGTTRDCRWFSSFYFFMRIVLYFIYATSTNNFWDFQTLLVLALLFTANIVLILYLKPYKKPAYNKLDILMHCNALLICIFASHVKFFIQEHRSVHILRLLIVFYIILSLPLLGAIAFVMYYLYTLWIKPFFIFLVLSFKGYKNRVCWSVPLDSDGDLNYNFSGSFPDRINQPELYNCSSTHDYGSIN